MGVYGESVSTISDGKKNRRRQIKGGEGEEGRRGTLISVYGGSGTGFLFLLLFFFFARVFCEGFFIVFLLFLGFVQGVLLRVFFSRFLKFFFREEYIAVVL